MGADWYSPFILFGSAISIPSGKTFASFLYKLLSLSLEKPFQIRGMLSQFHSRMEGMSEEDYESMSESAEIVIGFMPSNDMMVNCDRIATLKELMSSAPLNKYSFSVPTFRTGISWEGNPYEDTEYSDEEVEEVVEAPKQPAKKITAEEMNAMFFHT